MPAELAGKYQGKAAAGLISDGSNSTSSATATTISKLSIIVDGDQ